MKTFLDHFAAILGAFTISLIIVSVTHELGYFTIVGRHFQTLLTPTDYLVNSIVWLPGTAIFIWGWGEWDKLRPEPQPKKKVKSKPRHSKDWFLLVLSVGLVLMLASLLTWPPSKLSLISLMTVIFVGWSRVYQRFSQKIEGVDKDLRPVLKEFFLLAPPVLIAIFFFGLANAGSDMEDRESYYVYYKHSNKAEVKVFLRSFQLGVLVKDYDTNFVEFHPWENVLRIERPGAERSDPLGCNLFGLLCPFEKAAPPQP